VTADTRHPAARFALPVLGLALAAAMLPALSQPAGAAPPPGDQTVTIAPVKHLGPKTFTKRGPYAVGETTLKLPTNQAPVEVWYPARKKDARDLPKAQYDVVDWLPDFFKALVPAGESVTYPSGGVRGVDVAQGRFPLVVFSHGYAGYRDQSSFLTAWLASWGFVVAAPDHHSRDLTKVLGGPTGSTTDVDDLRETVTLMTKSAKARSGRFAGHIDTKLVGAVGHSAGGGAIQEFAAADRRVTTFVGLAPGTREGKLPRQPGLIMAGSTDGIIPSDRIIAAYDKLRGPKRLVVVNGGHHAFSDLCEVGSDQGGLLAVAEILHLPVPDQLKSLATDGCEAPSLPPTQAWPAIRQTVVAHLRHVFGFDRSAKGLRGLAAAYPGVVTKARSSR
jgi:predicted dienelactone hydrolase